MAKELPFFKFNISEWMLGRIQKQPESTQGMFINLCCKYWHKLGEYSFEDACDDFGEKRIISLERAKILRISENFLKISFLDEQLEEREIASKIASEKGRKSAQIRNKNKPQSAAVEQQLKTVELNPTEEKRREEKREEESESTRARESVSKTFEEKNFAWFEKQLSESWLDQMPSEKKTKLGRAKTEAWAHLSADKARLQRAGPRECMQLLNTWLSRMGNEKTNGIKNTNSAEIIKPREYANKL